MSDRQVILVARLHAAQLMLVHEQNKLMILRNGEAVPGAQWGEADLDAATDTFHRLMKEDGLE